MRDPTCTLCPLHEGATSICIEGDGSLDAPIWIVGEAPGYEEDQGGRPFLGRSGRKLRGILDELGYDADDVRITNVVRCRPPGNRDPELDELHACAQAYLFPEMAEHKPRFIIPVGAQPLRAFGKSGITRHRGQPFRYDLAGEVQEVRHYKKAGDKVITKKGVVHTVEVMPTFHPAYIGRFPQHEPTFRSDLATFKKITEDRFASDYEGEYRECQTPKEALAAYEALREASILSCDIETYAYPHKGALDPHSAGWRILSISLSPRVGLSYVFAVDHPVAERFGPPYVDLVRRILKRLLLDPARKYVWHNGKFDLKALKKRFGFSPRMTYDTMLMARLLDENSPADLKDLARRYCGAGRYEEAIDWSKKDPEVTYFDVIENKVKKACAIPEWDVLWPYNARDTDYALRVYQVQKETVRDQPKLITLFVRVAVPAASAAADMELHGLWLDRERIVTRMEENGRRMREAEAKILAYVPTQDELDGNLWDATDRETAIPRERFKASNNAHVSWLLHEAMRMPIMKINVKSNNASVDKDVLTALQDLYVGKNEEKYELLIAIEEHRRLSKYNSTYFGRWLKNMTDDGLYHHEYNPFAAQTGRWTGNMQNVPREKMLRSCVGAPPGWLLMETDLAQIEMRIVAHVSNDRNMLRIFREGGDPHFEAAMEFFRVTAAEVRANSELRSRAKPGNFGFLYGMYPPKFVVYARNSYKTVFTVPEAEEIRAGFFRKWADVDRWHSDVKRFLRDHQYVESPIGRRRRLPGIMAEDRKVRIDCELQALNAPVQAFASDICNMALVRIAALIEGKEDEIVMVMNNHDALAFRVREDRARYYAPIVRDIMRNPPLEEWFGIRLRVPIDADVTVGHHWGEPIKGFLEEVA